MKNENFKLYKKPALQPMRPYVQDEDMTGISVSDQGTPEVGGMIAINPQNEKDQWYFSKQFFEDNYIEEIEHSSDEPLIIGSFGWAVTMAKKGFKISRSGWNGSGMFAYIVPSAKYKAQTSVMLDMAFDDDLIPYREYWALFTAQKDVATWSPSGSDSLANDWAIVD